MNYSLDRYMFRLWIVTILFVQIGMSQSRGFRVAELSSDSVAWFKRSWAVVVGIDDYKSSSIPPLRFARADAEAVAEFLVSQQRISEDRLLVLINADATRENILKAFDELKTKTTHDDRVFFFFAGHGVTLPQADKTEVGYLLLYDSRSDSIPSSSLSTREIGVVADKIPARHLYFVMDACYGGSIFTRSTPLSSEAVDYLRVITGRVAKQAITAGGRNQQVLDNGLGGHSVFTYHFLEGVGDGKADINGDDLITASEIAAFVAPRVTSSSQGFQTPEYGSLPGNEGGDYVFVKQGVEIPKESKGDRGDLSKFELASSISLGGNTRIALTGGIGSYKSNNFTKGDVYSLQVDHLLGGYLVGLHLDYELGGNIKSGIPMTLVDPTPLDYRTKNIYLEGIIGLHAFRYDRISIGGHGGVGYAYFTNTLIDYDETHRKGFLSLSVGVVVDYSLLTNLGIRVLAKYRWANSSADFTDYSETPGRWELQNQTGYRLSLGIVTRF